MRPGDPHLFFKYRIHLSALYFLGYLNSSRHIFGRLDESALALGACFTSLGMSIYLFNMIFARAEDAINTPEECLGPEQKPFILAASLSLFVLPLIALALFSQTSTWISYLSIGLLGFLYSFPLGPTGFRLKKSSWTKILIPAVSIIWATLLVPLLLKAPCHGAILRAAWPRIIPWLLVIMATGLFWDIRDVRGDTACRIKTLPSLLGVPATVAFICGLMLLNLAHPNSLSISPVKVNSFLTLCFALGALKFTHRLYFHGLIFAQAAGFLVSLLRPL